MKQGAVLGYIVMMDLPLTGRTVTARWSPADRALFTTFETVTVFPTRTAAKRAVRESIRYWTSISRTGDDAKTYRVQRVRAIDEAAGR